MQQENPQESNAHCFMTDSALFLILIKLVTSVLIKGYCSKITKIVETVKSFFQHLMHDEQNFLLWQMY